MNDVIEYRIEYRHVGRRQGKWSVETRTWRGDEGRKEAIRSWVQRVASDGTSGWEHRIVSRRVSDWEPIEHMDEALALLSTEVPS